MKTPPDLVTFIVEQEVSGRAAYEKSHCRPHWPGGDSGVTIGIGWDCGYNSRAALNKEWTHLPSAVRNRFGAVLGLKGAAAKNACINLGDIRVSWEDALVNFQDYTLPRYEGMAINTYPGLLDTPSPCFGVIVSLTFNRGTDMDTRKDSRREMRAVREAIMSGRLHLVPGELRSMKRLWPNLRGLRDRREIEAQIWERATGVRP